MVFFSVQAEKSERPAISGIVQSITAGVECNTTTGKNVFTSPSFRSHLKHLIFHAKNLSKCFFFFFNTLLKMYDTPPARWKVRRKRVWTLNDGRVCVYWRVILAIQHDHSKHFLSPFFFFFCFLNTLLIQMNIYKSVRKPITAKRKHNWNYYYVNNMLHVSTGIYFLNWINEKKCLNIQSLLTDQDWDGLVK